MAWRWTRKHTAASSSSAWRAAAYASRPAASTTRSSSSKRLSSRKQFARARCSFALTTIDFMWKGKARFRVFFSSAVCGRACAWLAEQFPKRSKCLTKSRCRANVAWQAPHAKRGWPRSSRRPFTARRAARRAASRLASPAARL